MNIIELKESEMEKINGGGLASSTINSIVKAALSVYELGRQLGTGIRRLISGKYCPVN